MFAADVAHPCREIFFLSSDESGPTWWRVPRSGAWVETSEATHSPVIRAITPPVARPGRYKVCTDENQCGTLTVAP